MFDGKLFLLDEIAVCLREFFTLVLALKFKYRVEAS